MNSAKIPTSQNDLSDSATRLLHTAERLFAQKGLNSVSIREINRESGSKNHTAVQYHFGGLEQLIQAILDYRMIPLNNKRLAYLTELKASNNLQPRSMISALVKPFAEQLLEPEEDSYYISLLAQLFNRYDAMEIFLQNPERSTALQEVSELLMKDLDSIPDKLLVERMKMMGSQIIHTVAQWERLKAEKLISIDETSLTELTENLIDFVVGGLTSPVTPHSINKNF